MWIVINALWIFNMTVETGDFAVLRRAYRVKHDPARHLETLPTIQ